MAKMTEVVRVGTVILLFAIVSGAGAPSSSSGEDRSLSDKLKAMSPRERLQYLASLRKKGSDDPQIPFYMGNAMYALGKMDSAAAYFREAIGIDSTFSKAYVNLGLALDALRRSFGAESAFKKAISINPNDALAHCHLGFLYYSRKDYRSALAHIRKALEIDPKSAQAHYYLGLAFADAHIFKEAIEEWELTAKLDPQGELGKNARENVELIRQYIGVKVR